MEKITGKFVAKHITEYELTIPEGYYVKNEDSLMRKLNKGEVGLDLYNEILYWYGEDSTIGEYLPIYEIIPPKDVPEAAIVISTRDFYPKDMKIPEGYEYAGFMKVQDMVKLGITHYLSLTGNATECRSLKQDFTFFRIGLKRV